MVRGRERDKQRNIAQQRIEILFEKAKSKAESDDFKGANNYILKARKLATRFNIKLKKEFKNNICKHCYSYLVVNKTSSHKIDSKNKKVVISCFNCNKTTYYPYINEKCKKSQQ